MEIVIKNNIENMVENEQGSIDPEYFLQRLTPLLTAEIKGMEEKYQKTGRVLEKLLLKLKKKYWSLLPAFQILSFQMVREEIVHLATDGEKIFYNPVKLYEEFLHLGNKKAAKKYSDEILHIVLHGILGHFYLDENYKDKKLCWAIMDLLVEEFRKNCFPEMRLGWSSMDSLDEMQENNKRIKKLEKLLEKGLSAYYVVKNQKKSRKFILEQAALSDNHYIWHEAGDGSGKKGGASGTGNGKGKVKELWMMVSVEILGGTFALDKMSKASLQILLFKKLSDSDSTQFGIGAGGEEELYQANMEKKKSFSETLKTICREQECVYEDPESLDFMLYQYGLDMYGDVPLVEPLEENPKLHIKNIVLAIDTSGSCSGEVASNFLGAAYQILEDANALGQTENIYMVECDYQIQKVTTFQKAKEMQERVKKMTLHGFGGTSFIPVFEWIEELEKKENTEITALFYLTDGFGEYPEGEPDYPVYFVFPKRDYEMNQTNMSAHDWIKPLLLDS